MARKNNEDFDVDLTTLLMSLVVGIFWGLILTVLLTTIMIGGRDLFKNWSSVFPAAFFLTTVVAGLAIDIYVGYYTAMRAPCAPKLHVLLAGMLWIFISITTFNIFLRLNGEQQSLMLMRVAVILPLMHLGAWRAMQPSRRFKLNMNPATENPHAGKLAVKNRWSVVERNSENLTTIMESFETQVEADRLGRKLMAANPQAQIFIETPLGAKYRLTE